MTQINSSLVSNESMKITLTKSVDKYKIQGNQYHSFILEFKRYKVRYLIQEGWVTWSMQDSRLQKSSVT